VPGVFFAASRRHSSSFEALRRLPTKLREGTEKFFCSQRICAAGKFNHRQFLRRARFWRIGEDSESSALDSLFSSPFKGEAGRGMVLRGP
jgi:hypothetical protein